MLNNYITCQKFLTFYFERLIFGHFFSHFGQFGHLAETLLKQIYAYRTRIRLGKRAKKEFFAAPLRVYGYNDEKIAQTLSNSRVFQAVSHPAFAPCKSFGAQSG